MILEHLFVQDYRNLIQADLDFSHRLNCFVGHNGMGKTNLLDAIYYLSFCKSSINPSDTMTVRHGADRFQIQGTYYMPSGERTVIGCMSRPHGRKQFMRDRKEYSRFSDHIGYIPAVMLSPQDSELISGGSEERRRFMDMVISQYDHDYLKDLIDYNRALMQRNILLRSEIMPDAELFLMWEMIMVDKGMRIYTKRQHLVERLSLLFDDMYSRIGESHENVSLKYCSHASEGDLAAMFESGRARERIVGYTLHGIQKDELEMCLGGYPIKREGSQGQNKSFLTALKFAQYTLLAESCVKMPILLMDDIFDKLDAGRVERILRIVANEPGFGQVFITDVDRNHIDMILEGIGIDHKVFTIENGNVI
ncbi:MAG: DNA replication and repair protein RecF [Bacteroidaceae bacterium]|nr:DNA replication and repair protein RecF [Bacteroidaceae bacterium]